MTATAITKVLHDRQTHHNLWTERPQMNDFGFGAHMRAAFTMFDETSRGTGRTTDICRAAKKDDTIVVGSEAAVRPMRSVLREIGKFDDVKVEYRNPKHAFGRYGTVMKGIVLFDDSFVSEFWKSRIHGIGTELVAMQENWSKREFTESERRHFEDQQRASRVSPRWDIYLRD